MQSDFEAILSLCEEKALQLNPGNGHFTLMKFTTNWRAGFATPRDLHHIQEFASGPTAMQAMLNALSQAEGKSYPTETYDKTMQKRYEDPSLFDIAEDGGVSMF